MEWCRWNGVNKIGWGGMGQVGRDRMVGLDLDGIGWWNGIGWWMG